MSEKISPALGDPSGNEQPTSSRRRLYLTIGTGALVLLTAAGITAASALFTSQATVTGQQVTTSTIEILATSTAAIDLNDLLPGDSASTTVTVENTGSESALLSIELPLANSSDAALAQQLDATVTVSGASSPFSYKLSHWQTGRLVLSSPLASGATLSFDVGITLPVGAPNSLQGTQSAFTIQVDAVQERNTTPPTANAFVTGS